MMIDEQAVISAERSVEAVTWLRNLLTTQVSAEEATRQTASLQATPTAIQTIEAVRKVVEHRQAQQRQTNKALDALAKQYDSVLQQWEDGGASILRDVLDPDALSETHKLADVCTALKLEPERALSRVHQMSALSRLAEQYLAVDHRHTQRKFALGTAQQAVRDAVDELRNAIAVLQRVSDEVQTQEREKGAMSEREQALRQDIDKYGAQRKEAEDEVGRTGLQAQFTHAKIAQDGERLRQVEHKLEVVKLQLEKYHGMPADMDICGEMVSGMKKQIDEIDREIEEAINSMN